MLESYVTPILMSYVNRYIKNLKPSDLQLSLWGGDVVLSKLELKLDVLEQVPNYLDKAPYNRFGNESVLPAPCTSADVSVPMLCCALTSHQTESQRTDENRA